MKRRDLRQRISEGYVFVVEERRRIEAAGDIVFTRLADVAGYRDWLSGSWVHRACHVASDRVSKVGMTYRDDTWFGAFHGEIIEFEEPHEIVFEQVLRWLGVRVFEARLASALSAEDGATILVQRFEGRPAPGLRAAERLVVSIVRAERQRVIAALAGSVESRPN